MTTNKNCKVLGPDYVECCRHGNHDGPHYDGAHTYMWGDDECLELPPAPKEKRFYPRVNRTADHTQVHRLTKREREVLQTMADGLTSEQSATTLFLAYDTIRSHKQRIFKKIGAKSAAEAVAMAIRAEVIS